MDIAGVAHVQPTVNDLQRAMPFCGTIPGFLGMRSVVRASNGPSSIGGRTAVMITRSSDANRAVPFDQRRIGLHHLCVRVPGKGLLDGPSKLPLGEFPGYGHYPESFRGGA